MSVDVHFAQKLSDEQRAGWQRLLDATSHSHPTQFNEWGTFLSQLGYIPFHFYLTGSQGLRFAALCAGRSIPATGKRFFDLGRGPVFDDVETFQETLPQLLTALRRQRAAAVRIKPLWSGDAAERLRAWLAGTGWQPRFDESHHTLEIDLRPSADTILSQFKSAVRYEIRRADKVGVEVHPANTDAEFEDWFALYVRMCKGKGVGVPNHRFHRAQWDCWLKYQQQGVLILARYQDRLVAGSVVMRDHNRCVYFYGASTERIPGVPLGEPLQWHAIRWAKQQGCSVYDLGGFHPKEPKGTPQYHVDRFKLGFAQEPVAYLPCHELVLDPVAYAVWKTAKRVAPKVRSLLRRATP